jgi:hypothetical protein
MAKNTYIIGAELGDDWYVLVVEKKSFSSLELIEAFGTTREDYVADINWARGEFKIPEEKVRDVKGIYAKSVG